MRILICGINYAPDLIGVAKYNTECCEWLAGRGHEVRMVTAPPYYPHWSVPFNYRNRAFHSEHLNGVRLTRVPIYVPRKPTGPKRLVHHATFALTSVGPVIWQALSWRPDLMLSVAPSLMSALAVAFVARRIGVPSWLHLQDLEVDAAFGLGLLKNRRLLSLMLATERTILRSFDCISTITPKLLSRLEQKGVDRTRLREIRNWTDTNAIAPEMHRTGYRRALGLRDSDVVALYSGTMSHKQGLDLILEAARCVSVSDPDVQFVLAGEGPGKAKIQAMAAGLTNVHFLPLQAGDRFAQLLASADIHLVPQRSEAADLVLPSKLGSIFASGRPVVTMAARGTSLANEVEGAGLVVPPGDANALAAGVRKLAGDMDLRRRLGGVGREYALARWDKTRILCAWENELSGLSNGGRAVAAAPAVWPADSSMVHDPQRSGRAPAERIGLPETAGVG